MEAGQLQKPLKDIGNKLHRRMDGDPRLDAINGLLTQASLLLDEIVTERREIADRAIEAAETKPTAVADMTKIELWQLGKLKYGADLDMKLPRSKLLEQIEELAVKAEHRQPELTLRAQLYDTFGKTYPEGWNMEQLRDAWTALEAEARAKGPMPGEGA